MNDDLERRTTAQGMLLMAKEYIDAYKILEEKNNKITYLFHVKFYLLAHSIELSFKAYLKNEGLKLFELKALSHDLKFIYNKIVANYKYKIDSNSIQMIERINQYYKNKEFEYPKIGAKNVVPIEKLFVVAKMIMDATEWQIKDSKLKV